MARLKIPAEYRGGISKLLSLSADAFELLVSALSKAPYKLYQADLLAEVQKRVEAISATDLRDILRAVWMMEVVRSGADLALDEFVPDVLESIESLKIRPDSLDESATAARLQRVLGIPSLSVASKARALLQEGHSFCRARVLTDIRPVFVDTGDAPGTPTAAVIVHNLRIGYHDAGVTRELIISMDAEDLNQLSESLARAKAKQERLESVLANANLVYLRAD